VCIRGQAAVASAVPGKPEPWRRLLSGILGSGRPGDLVNFSAENFYRRKLRKRSRAGED
jgi:hypothetical protein